MNCEPDTRPDPDELLKLAGEPAKDAAERGRLKIFFGYCAGVGKTYAMLLAARDEWEKGTDVIAGYIEPHTRAETMALLDGFPVLPPQTVVYRNIALSEFDLDAALKRKPRIILVDELAHTNAPGVRNRKRYQDIEELLNAGIDVYSTINVQHLESLNDVIQDGTKIPVRETVPDYIFDEADKVELVDIEPEELLKRFSEGKIYGRDRTETAKKNFFTRDNLDFLRETSMRRSADRIYRDALTKKLPEGRQSGGGRILVLVGPSPSSAKNVRVACRMAESLHTQWTAVFVETAVGAQENGEQKKSLRKNLNLAEQLGAELVMLSGEDIVTAVADYAKTSDVSSIVIGKTRRKRSARDLFKEDFEDRLITLVPTAEVHIIPDSANTKTFNPSARRQPPRHDPLSVSDAVKTAAACLFTAAAFACAGFLNAGFAGAAAAYVCAVVLVSRYTDTFACGYITAAAGLACMYGTLIGIPGAGYGSGAARWLEPLVCAVAAVAAGSATAGIRRLAHSVTARERRNQTLFEIQKRLLVSQDRDGIVRILNTYIGGLFDRSVAFYTRDPGEDGGKSAIVWPEGEDTSVILSADEQAAAHWVFVNKKRAGAGTDTLSAAAMLYLPIISCGAVLGVIGISASGGAISEDDRLFMQMIISQTALALERFLPEGFIRPRSDSPRQPL